MRIAERIKKFFNQFAALENVPRFFRMIWAVSPRMAFWNGALRLFQAAMPVSMLYIGKEIIDGVIAAVQHPAGNDQWGLPSTLWFWILLELGLAVLSSFLNRVITVTDNLLGDLVANDSSVRIMRHAATLDLFQFEDPVFYDKLERARTQTMSRTVLMSLVLSQLQDVITILFLIGGLAAFSPWLLALLFLAVLPSFLGETHFNQQTYSLTRSWTPERRELDYLRFIGASDNSAKEIKIFGMEHYLADRFKEISDRYYLANRKLTLKRASWGSLFSLLATLSYYSAYLFIVIQAAGGIITIGTLSFLAGSFQRMQALLQGVMGRFSRVAEMALYLQDYFDFLALKPLETRTGATRIPRPITSGFVFENVSFRYPNTEKWALYQLSFHLRAGEKLALVGENGAGKTTIVKLLAGLYKPTEGRILLDGVDLRDYDPADLRRNIGVIFQDFVRFSFTAGENITVGDIEALSNQKQMVVAAEKSMADTVVEGLPKQYAQMLGKRFKDGVDLSGGQWQKVALARAYMREAQLVILDEPTAALDARAEHEVFVRFAGLMEGRSAVLISHRFSTVRMADRILFLENGQLLELGSHQELLDQKGKYAELFHLQAKGYQ
ncbi:MAG: ABC transporter ATP-binding protein [Lewinellaceae bacterium]|nr:ABC transporter ATP-binding protein [Lewinellaceae bacterium]